MNTQDEYDTYNGTFKLPRVCPVSPFLTALVSSVPAAIVTARTRRRTFRPPTASKSHWRLLLLRLNGPGRALTHKHGQISAEGCS